MMASSVATNAGCFGYGCSPHARRCCWSLGPSEYQPIICSTITIALVEFCGSLNELYVVHAVGSLYTSIISATTAPDDPLYGVQLSVGPKDELCILQQ